MWLYWSAFAVVMLWTLGVSWLWALNDLPLGRGADIIVVTLSIVCIIETIALSGITVWSTGKKKSRANSNSGNRENNKNGIVNTLVGNKERTANQSADEDEDTANQSIANATWIIFIATTANIGIAALTWGILSETNTHIAQQLAVMKADQRPWVGLDEIVTDGHGRDEGFGFIAIIKNGGKTPSLKTRVTFKHKFYKADDLDKRFPTDCVDKCSVGMLLPDSTYKWPMEMTANEVASAVSNPTEGYFVLGRIDYEDAGNHYWTTICYVYDKKIRDLTVWSSHNDVGSEPK